MSAIALTLTPAPAAQAVDPAGERILVFHATAGERHDSIPAGLKALEELGRRNGFAVDDTRDGAVFTPPGLARYRAVVFLSANGEVLTAEQETAFKGYVEAGGGFVGIHDAARVQPASAWFTSLIGTRPAGGAGQVRQAIVEAGDRLHPATKELPLEWTRTDEWFDWNVNPSGRVHTVARVRGLSEWNHPVSWCHDVGGGRSFYTAMGHTAESFSESLLRAHLLGAVQWASGLVRGDCQATIAANYRAERLTQPNQPGQLDQIGEPHGLATAPDGRVFYIGRGGQMTGAPAPITDWADPRIGLGPGTVHVYDPATGAVSLAATLDVFGNKGGGPEHNKTEEGLLGIALDPRFGDNGWIYLYYMPHASIDRVNRVGTRTVSRFTLDSATNRLDLGSEKVILSWEAQIDRCCHAGGGMAFDRKGNLYIASGDNNSSQCDGCGGSAGGSGYSGNNPVPEFAGISQQDARRTSGNTNNLNGKILRVHPSPDGGYTIPPGNLFTGKEEGGGKTRPEIYAMGVRNPTRLAVDPHTGWLLTGWVGPDAGSPNPVWGPAKYETATVIAEPGNYGWPYCMGNKQPYRDRDRTDITKPAGWYDCDNPRNESPRNTGLVNLPPVKKNNMWYAPQGGGPDFTRDESGIPSYDLAGQRITQPFLSGTGGAQAVMPGPMYRFDRHSGSALKWPRYWDGKWFIGDFYAGRPKVAALMDPRTAAGGGAPAHVEDLKPLLPAGLQNLMDWKFGPDGVLYILDYGTGFFNATSTSALWRVTYHGRAATPAPTASARSVGPSAIAFSSNGSGGVSYRWDFGDGTGSAVADPVHVYGRGGDFTATLRVRYADGEEAATRVAVSIACAAPDARPTVRFLDTDSAVPNRQAGGGCTINDLIDDERAWHSAGAFTAHVALIGVALVKAEVISPAEFATLIGAAARSRIGAPGGPRPYESIFDGSAESLRQWIQAPGGAFELRPDGSLRSTGGLGMLWYAGGEFADFSMRLQFRDARTDGGFSNSGVFVRFPDPRTPLEQRPPGSCGTVGAARTSPAWVAIYCGHEIQIYDGPSGEPQKTGSIYNFGPVGLGQGSGVWNDYEIRVVGQHYTVIRNGIVINEFDNTPGKVSSRPSDPPTDLRQFLSGFVGLQNHGRSDLMDFRNVRVRPL